MKRIGNMNGLKVKGVATTSNNGYIDLNNLLMINPETRILDQNMDKFFFRVDRSIWGQKMTGQIKWIRLQKFNMSHNSNQINHKTPAEVARYLVLFANCHETTFVKRRRWWPGYGWVPDLHLGSYTIITSVLALCGVTVTYDHTLEYLNIVSYFLCTYLRVW